MMAVGEVARPRAMTARDVEMLRWLGRVSSASADQIAARPEALGTGQFAASWPCYRYALRRCCAASGALAGIPVVIHSSDACNRGEAGGQQLCRHRLRRLPLVCLEAGWSSSGGANPIFRRGLAGGSMSWRIASKTTPNWWSYLVSS